MTQGSPLLKETIKPFLAARRLLLSHFHVSVCVLRGPIYTELLIPAGVCKLILSIYRSLAANLVVRHAHPIQFDLDFDSNNVLAPVRLLILLDIVHIYTLGQLLSHRAASP